MSVVAPTAVLSEDTEGAQILAECNESGASIVSMALAHGVNANLVHKGIWLAH